jgi:hypothetical protein
MKRRFAPILAVAVTTAVLFAFGFQCFAQPQTLTPQQQLAFDIYK